MEVPDRLPGALAGRYRSFLMEDGALLERWKTGDAEAGNLLFARHFSSIRRFFRNKVTPGEVEDLIQRSFMACVESRDRFRGDSSFRTYLFAVARNQLYKFLRDRRSSATRVDPDFSVSSVIALGMTPSSVAAARQEEELLLTALQRTSVDEQTLLELRYWEGLKAPEIATVFEISPAAVRVRLHRARGKLQGILEEMKAPQADLDVEVAVQGLRLIEGPVSSV